METEINYNFTKREIGEIYNGLVSLHIFCRDKIGMKLRAKFVGELASKVYRLMEV